MNEPVELSAIIPVTERYDDVADLYQQYKQGLQATGLSFEVIYVLDGEYQDVEDELMALRESGEAITIVTLAKWFGEATALNVGFEQATGDRLLTLPAYQQVDASEIPRLVAALDDVDMVLARRWPRTDSIMNRIQSRLFNGLLKLVSDLDMHDAGCSMRAIRRRVVDEVELYGDQHRFFPILAYRMGFRIRELNVKQAQKDVFQRIYPLGIYVRRLLDILTILFLVRFTKKPLRFFGLLGVGILTMGSVATLVLIVQRLWMDMPLADRPALFLSSLLIVLGIQILAVGLIGEIIIFTHAKDIKEYTIDKIIN